MREIIIAFLTDLEGEYKVWVIALICITLLFTMVMCSSTIKHHTNAKHPPAITETVQ